MALTQQAPIVGPAAEAYEPESVHRADGAASGLHELVAPTAHRVRTS